MTEYAYLKRIFIYILKLIKRFNRLHPNTFDTHLKFITAWQILCKANIW
jgi:hypothetical protein